jgi:predicted molibdopterin-dependent oxidoreductase YjgC
MFRVLVTWADFPMFLPATRKLMIQILLRNTRLSWNINGLSEKIGLTVTEMTNKAAHGNFKSLYIIGENPLVSDPDLNHTEKAFNNLEFLVVQDIFLTETAKIADVVLPSFCFAEKEGTFTNTERRVQRVRKAVKAPGLAKEDWKIICEIATRMGTAMDYNNAGEIFEEIRRVTPSYAGITWKRLDENGGIHWPCPTIDHPGTPILHTAQFTRGKGLFHAIDHQPPAEVSDDALSINAYNRKSALSLPHRFNDNEIRWTQYNIARVFCRDFIK